MKMKTKVKYEYYTCPDKKKIRVIKMNAKQKLCCALIQKSALLHRLQLGNTSSSWYTSLDASRFR